MTSSESKPSTTGSPSLLILWPHYVEDSIFERNWALSFCESTSHQAVIDSGTSFRWYRYTGDEELGDLDLPTHHTSVLLISETLLVLSARSIQQLMTNISSGGVIGPVFNNTKFVQQLAALKSPYVNLSTFSTAAENLQSNRKPVNATELDPSCLMLDAASLRSMSADTKIATLPQAIKGVGDCWIDTTALVNRFSEFYDNERPDLLTLIPETVQSILDIGTAFGAYGRMVQREHPEIEVYGVELNAHMAAVARPCYEHIFNVPVEELETDRQFDLINCGDVLEHLVDPWTTLKSLGLLLKPGGYLVLSVPNTAHWSIVRDLLNGRFDYIPVGLSCVGHLRWYTAESMQKMLLAAGFVVEELIRQKIPLDTTGEHFVEQACVAGLGCRTELETSELLFRARWEAAL